MADRLISGGASSSSDEYEEDEEGEGAGENDGNDYGEADYRQSWRIGEKETKIFVGHLNDCMFSVLNFNC